MTKRTKESIMWAIAIAAGCFFGIIVAMHLTGSV
jgi:hypothetical protein